MRRPSGPGPSALLGLLGLLGLLAITPVARGESELPNLNDTVLRDARNTIVPLERIVSGHRLTVIVFYGATCPCFAAHRERLQKLATDLAPRGVGFVIVDSERHVPGEAPAPQAVAPHLPVFRDDGGRLARRLGARYATESFVVDAAGQVRYRGGIDSDRKVLNSDADPTLGKALDSLLAGKAPPLTTSKALGCALRLL
jgi:Redoxin